MRELQLFASDDIDLTADVNISKSQNQKTYHIMHMDKLVAAITKSGVAHIYNQQFMPYDLYLESGDTNDIDILINNLDVFYHWCASRVLTLDRQYAKEILNSIGVAQATTDRERAKISLSYHCVSLTDVYWVKESDDNITFGEINLYDHTLNDALVEISLRGQQMTVTNQELAQDLSTKGCFPKAWIRTNQGFKLLKDGGEDIVRKELLASEICQCFEINQVKYGKRSYKGQVVTESEIVSSKDRSLVTKMAFDVYAINNDLDTLQICKKLDPDTYYGMNILDYLIGNTDRHPENWGFLVDNHTNQYISLYPVMDFNQSFLSYDTLDGANCQTVLPRKMTQREAAIEAVQKIGLKQIKNIDMEKFGSYEKEREMFQKRLAELKQYDVEI